MNFGSRDAVKFHRGHSKDTVWNQDLLWKAQCSEEKRTLKELKGMMDVAKATGSTSAFKIQPGHRRKRLLGAGILVADDSLSFAHEKKHANPNVLDRRPIRREESEQWLFDLDATGYRFTKGVRNMWVKKDHRPLYGYGDKSKGGARGTMGGGGGGGGGGATKGHHRSLGRKGGRRSRAATPGAPPPSPLDHSSAMFTRTGGAPKSPTPSERDDELLLLMDTVMAQRRQRKLAEKKLKIMEETLTLRRAKSAGSVRR